MSKIILIRHGQASFGTSDYDRLSELGKKQAEITGKYFARAKIHFDAVFSGTMRRQMETAEIALKDNVSVQCLELLNEYDFMSVFREYLPDLLKADPTMPPVSEQEFSDEAVFHRFFGKVMKRWASGEHNRQGVEIFSQFIGRIAEGMEKIAAIHRDTETIGIFTSGGVIAMILHLVLKIPAWEALKLGWQIVNCSISSIISDTRGLRLETFNSYAHLEQEGVPGLITYK